MHASDVVLAGLGAVVAVAGVTAAACAADPIVMMAHQDVVPVEGQDWEHDPFGAEVIDGQIWGRGTLGTKCIVGAFFEAAASPPAPATLPDSVHKDEQGPRIRPIRGSFSSKCALNPRGYNEALCSNARRKG